MTLNVKIAREALGWSQKELADRMGVSQSAISLWEKGRVPKVPMIAFIEGLLREAGVNPDLCRSTAENHIATVE